MIQSSEPHFPGEFFSDPIHLIGPIFTAASVIVPSALLRLDYIGRVRSNEAKAPGSGACNSYLRCCWQLMIRVAVQRLRVVSCSHFAWLRCLQPSASMLLPTNDKCCCTEVEGDELFPFRLAEVSAALNSNVVLA